MEGRGRAPNQRGGSTIQWGEDVTAAFLEGNHLDLIVRSHEVRDQGLSSHHGGKVITVFSAPNYCDSNGNLGAVLIFEKRSQNVRYLQFDCVKHPDLPPMYYKSTFSRM
jgi:serine/threonine-protein phosphatase 5